MWDPTKIRAVVLALGWPKASFCLSVVLLFRGVVTFDQCLLLIFCGALIHFLPPRKELAQPKKSAIAPRESQIVRRG
jgi:hypothetical protein